MEKTIQKILFVSLVIVHAQTKRTFLSRLTHFSQNHPVVLFVALLGCFLLVPSISFAAERDTNWFEDGVIWILYWVYVLFSQFVSLAATIFLWVIDSGVFSALMNDTAIYTVWLTVRDFCNIFFILVLLFSAFATIFQLEKYEWKKTLPTLIIMALLVNFSFPISRFVIDLANVPMYFFAQNTVGQNANAIAGEILSASKIQNVILPGVESSSQVKNVPQMFAATICMFLFGISFLVLSLLMLTRMIALAILVMFSPIGFVGMITPALHKFAHDWWDKLFKWAFYGPIAVMLVLVAIVVMQAGANIQSSHAMQNMVGSSSEYEFIKNIAFLAIPIVLFWIAITQAEKYSNDMSGLGIKWGSQLGRWGARTLTGYNWGMRRYGAYSAERKRRSDAKLADSWFGARLGRLVNSGLDNIRSGASVGPIGRGGAEAATNRLSQEDKRLADEAGKRRGMADMSDEELRDIVAHGSRAEKAAALIQLAGGSATRGELENVRKTFGVDSQVTRAFEAKMRAFDPQAVFTKDMKLDSKGNIVGGTLNTGRLESFVRSGQIDWKKISDKSLTPELLQYAFKAKTISNKDLDDLRSKGTEYTNAIKRNLDVAIESMNKENGGKWDLTNDIQRNIQSAYLAQTGKFHATMERTPDSSFVKTDSNGVVSASSRVEAKGDLLARADANVLKRMDKSLIDSSPTGIQNLTVLMERMSAGKYAEIITEMEKSGVAQAAVAKDMNDYIRSLTGATGNAARLKGVADKDHRLAHLR